MVDQPRDPDAGRRAARVLLLDGDDRLLLFCGVDPHVPDVRFWFTPGGGVEDGESLTDAARRELREETGCAVEIGPPVWTRESDFDFEGEAVQQHETYFVARVPAWEVDTSGFTDLEQRAVLWHRWWTLDELRITPETVYPSTLARHLDDLLRDGPPAQPVVVEA